ncbi:MAG: hydratase, partial [Clostridioides sp.]|nr:hydratase [Clostridioides sp.]
MIKLIDSGAYLLNGTDIIQENDSLKLKSIFPNLQDRNISISEEAKKGTIAYSILQNHNISGDEKKLRIKFDSMASHDITFVGIIQTARASGLEKFPIPYVLTNCHNSLCAVGGTINEDDHMFGLSAAKKYGGIYVPPHIAVIHQYMREMMAGC